MQCNQWNRREFITLLGGAAGALPLAVRAQHVPRVGALIPYPETDTEAQSQMGAFEDALQRLRLVPGQSVQIDQRWTGGFDFGTLRAAAKELVSLRPDVIISRSTAATAALLYETRTRPVVFLLISDPIGDGFVFSMARPGGNATGFTDIPASEAGKWLELLKEMAPRTDRVAVLFGTSTAPGGGSYYQQSLQATGRSMDVEVIAVQVKNAVEIEQELSGFARKTNGALIVTPDQTTTVYRDALVDAAARHRLPAIYPFRYVAREGGLASYGVDITDQYRHAADYVDRIIKGEKPRGLPVMQPDKYELIVNLKTAKTLGLEIPPTLLARADEVIE
jgi:putative ABC transport system substrate-binding protein